MVSAWATQSQIVLGQIKTEEKSNEITAIKELLKTLLIEGCLITIDAMGCQKDIAETITAKGGDYLLAVKDNQPLLRTAIEATFEGRQRQTYLNPVIKFHETTEKNRDRMETRRCWVTQSLNKIPMADELIKINKCCHVGIRANN